LILAIYDLCSAAYITADKLLSWVKIILNSCCIEKQKVYNTLKTAEEEIDQLLIRNIFRQLEKELSFLFLRSDND